MSTQAEIVSLDVINVLALVGKESLRLLLCP